MKSLFSVIVALFITLVLFSQKNKKINYFFSNSKGEATAEKNAAFLTTVQKVNDTCWQYQNYVMRGPMISSLQFKDKEGKLAHGACFFMRPDGTLDSIGHFVDGKPHGTWRYFDAKGMLVSKKEFAIGELIATPDITNDTSLEVGNPDVEAQFAGESNTFLRYLIHNLRYPKYAMDNGIQGKVVVYFLIDENGRIHDEIVLKSVEYTIDNEALRLIRESPQWVPAKKNGSQVKSYKKQPITFQVFTKG